MMIAFGVDFNQEGEISIKPAQGNAGRKRIYCGSASTGYFQLAISPFGIFGQGLGSNCHLQAILKSPPE